MKRSQTSHDPLIRGLNTADVFCRCNIIIFSMRTQEAGLNKPRDRASSETPRRARARSAISSAGRAARRISAGALNWSTCWRFSRERESMDSRGNRANSQKNNAFCREERLRLFSIRRIAADVTSVFDFWLRPALKSPLYHRRESQLYFRLFRHSRIRHQRERKCADIINVRQNVSGVDILKMIFMSVQLECNCKMTVQNLQSSTENRFMRSGGVEGRR